jgi:hypothetical protein
MRALLAVSPKDAEKYKRIFPDIADAKVFYVDDPSRMQGYRCTAAYATPLARFHKGYEKAWYTMHNNYTLCNVGAPRVL